MTSQVPVRAARDGSPLPLPRTGSLAAVWLAGGQETVRVSLPAGPPFSALRITGTARPVVAAGVSGITACAVTVDSVEFTGASAARVPVAEYQAAQPGPLWRVALGVLHHLEHGHLAELVRCVRAHGLTGAEWVVPRGRSTTCRSRCGTRSPAAAGPSRPELARPGPGRLHPCTRMSTA